MKVALILLAIVGATVAMPRVGVSPKAGTLIEAIEQLLENVDTECLLKTVEELSGRADGQEVLEYLRGADFRAAIDAVKSEPAYASLKAFALARGVDIAEILQKIADLIGIPRTHVSLRKSNSPFDFSDVVDELAKCLNTQELLRVLLDLLATNDEFVELVTFIGTDEINSGYLRLKANEAIKAVAQKLRDNGVDIDTIIALIESILGLGPRKSINAGTLIEAIEQLLENVDTECLLKTVEELSGRADGQEVLEYLRGADFRAAIDAVKSEPAYASLKAFALARGVDIAEILQKIADLIGIPRTHVSLRKSNSPFDFSDVVDELAKCLNTQELLRVLLDLLATNDEFVELVTFIGTDEINSGYLRLKANEAIKAVAQKLRDNGVDIDTIIALIESILGLGPRKSINAGTLIEAIEQLLENVDTECLLKTVEELSGRADGQEVLEYLRGADFRAAIDAVKSEPAYASLKAFALARGVDIAEILQKIADLIGIPRTHVSLRKSNSPFDFSDVVDELAKCLNTQELLRVLLDLLATNDEFVELVTFIGTDEINSGYLRLKANEAIKAVAQKLRDNGVDIDTIIALIESILGLGPRKSINAGTLIEAIEQLLENVDTECLLKTVEELSGRADGQEVLEYLRGADFRAAIDAVKSEPAYASLKAFALARGVDIAEILQKIADLIGIPRTHVSLRKSNSPFDFSDVVDELAKCLNTQELLRVLLDLLATNDEFVELVTFIGTDEINSGYLRLKANEAIKAVAQKLRDNGVDIDTIIALIESILGLGPRKSINAGTLIEAIEQLLENVDTECLLKTVEELSGRADGQEVLEYLRGADFRAAIDAVKSEPAYASLKAFALARGVDIAEILQKIADLIGIPRTHVSLRKSNSPFDFSDVVDELAKCLNTQELLRVLLDLLATNDEFVELVTFIGTDEINSGYLRLKANEAIKAVAQKLRDNGVDIDTIIALIESILGLGPRRY